MLRVWKVHVQTFKLYLQCVFLKKDSNEKNIYKAHTNYLVKKTVKKNGTILGIQFRNLIFNT